MFFVNPARVPRTFFVCSFPSARTLEWILGQKILQKKIKWTWAWWSSIFNLILFFHPGLVKTSACFPIEALWNLLESGQQGGYGRTSTPGHHFLLQSQIISSPRTQKVSRGQWSSRLACCVKASICKSEVNFLVQRLMWTKIADWIENFRFAKV